MTTATKPEKDTRNIYERLHAVMEEVTYIQKTHEIKMSGGGYKVTTHDAVTAKVRPVLVKHRVLYIPQKLQHVQNGNRTEVTLDIVFVNVDDPADRLAVPTLGYGIDSGDKGPGKAVSYAVKYALLKALGLETGDDADLTAEVEHKEPEKPKNDPGVMKVKAWAAEHLADLHSSEDGEDFIQKLEASKGHWIRVCGKYPGVWVGPERTGLVNDGAAAAAIYEVRDSYDTFIQTVEAKAADAKEAGK